MNKKNRKFPFLTAVTAVAMATTAITPVSAASFSDIGHSPYKEAIEGLKKQGIIDGYSNGQFQPNRELTRSDVVKMLGKYLVSIGYEIPSDYKTYMRFQDLNANSQDELLQYAALVYDQGVFNGNQGRLLATQKLSMQHMAVVLVRALSAIDGFDYVSYVEGQRYLQEYLDIEDATVEGQAAINVIDYYDFYKKGQDKAYFYPTDIAVRGQFAHFLYHLLQVESPVRNQPDAVSITTVKALTETRLTVTLSDDSVHNVTLEEPLVEHVPTSVTFRINGRSYTKIVTYKPVELIVKEAEFINSGQFVLHFNQPVTLKKQYHYNDLTQILHLKSTAGTLYDLTRGELSKDGLTFTVTLGQVLPVNARYNVELFNIHAEDGSRLVDESESMYYSAHSEGPYVDSTEHVGTNKVQVNFSEPIYQGYSTSSISYKLANGTTVTGVRATFQENRRYTSTNNYSNYANYVTLDLSGAYAKGHTITASTPIYVEFNHIRDIAGNYAKPNPLKVAVTKGTVTSKDGVAPKLMSVEQVGAKKMKLVFSEPVEPIGYYDLSFESASTSYYIEDMQQSDDQKSIILTMDDYLSGRVTIKSETGSYVYDLSGESAKISTSKAFTYDNTPAKVMSTEVIREDNKQYLFVTFDRNIMLGDAPTAILQNGMYHVNNQRSNMNTTEAVRIYQAEANQVKIPLSKLIGQYDFEKALYEGQLIFTDVYNEYEEQAKNGAVSFTRGKDHNYNTEELKLVAVETSRTNPTILESNRIVLNFNYPVDERKATDLRNYALAGYKLLSARVSLANPKQVELIVDNTITAPVSPYLSVWGLSAENAVIQMEDYYERVPLSENIAPKAQTIAKTGLHEMTITYNEAIATIDPNALLVHSSAGELMAQTVSNHPTDPTKLVLTFGKELSANGTYTIDLRPGRVVRDLQGNIADFSKITLYR